MVCCSSLLFSQRTFTPAEKKLIDQRSDSIINAYWEYSSFVADIDAEKISENIVGKFKDLFVSYDAEVINDIDYTKKLPTRIPLKKYIEYVREWYPQGLTVDLKVKKKNPPETLDKRNYSMVVNATKEVKGLYLDEHLYAYKAAQNILIRFSDQINGFKILKIEDTIGNDSCTKLRYLGKENLVREEYKSAKAKFEQALYKYCPTDELCKQGLASADSGIRANRIPIYLQVHVLPGYAMFPVTENNPLVTVNGLSSSSGISYGGGVGLEIGLLRSKTGLLSAGVSFDVVSWSTTLKAKTIGDSIKGFDIDHDSVTFIDTLKNISETAKIMYLQIPLYIRYDLKLSRSVSVFGKIGVKTDLAISKKYKSTIEEGDYRGKYYEYGGVILYGNELAAYGYGNYRNISTNSTDIKDMSSLNISVYAAVGLNASISRMLELFAGIEYVQGITNIAKSNKNFITDTRTSVNSLFGVSKGTVSNLNLDIGVRIKIFSY